MHNKTNLHKKKINFTPTIELSPYQIPNCRTKSLQIQIRKQLYIYMYVQIRMKTQKKICLLDKRSRGFCIASRRNWSTWLTRSSETFSPPQPSPTAEFEADEFDDDVEEELQEAEAEPSQSSWGGGLEESFLSKRRLMDSSKSAISHDSGAPMSSTEPSIAPLSKLFFFSEKEIQKKKIGRERKRKQAWISRVWMRPKKPWKNGEWDSRRVR